METNRITGVLIAYRSQFWQKLAPKQVVWVMGVNPPINLANEPGKTGISDAPHHSGRMAYR